MKKYLFIMLATMLPLGAFAMADDDEEVESIEAQVKYVTSYEELKAGAWKEMTGVKQMKVKTKGKGSRKSAYGFKFDTENKDAKKKLHDETFAILVGDTMPLLNISRHYIMMSKKYVGRKSKFDKVFVPFGYTLDDRVYFCYYNVAQEKAASVAGAGLGGIAVIAASMASSAQAFQTHVVYVLDHNVGRAYNCAIPPDFKELVHNDKAILKEYKSEKMKKRCLAPHCFPLLQKAGVIPASDKLENLYLYLDEM